MDKDILDLICCPKCNGDLKFIAGNKKRKILDKLFCKKCNKKYLIKDNIPILIDEDF